MDSPQNCVSCCMNKHLIITSIVFLLISNLAREVFWAEGRLLMTKEMGEKKKITEVSFIGSGPPKCERRCAYCVHCEAVQVPISAPHKQGLKPAGAHFLHSTPTTVNSRADDDDSNYKPISWKCKCGDFIFNP